MEKHEQDRESLEMRARLLGSLLFFTQTFYKILNNREFEIGRPIGREPHQITICKTLTKVFYLELNRVVVNVPPRYGKSTLLVYFIAWAMAHYPDCQFLYLSYSKDLATSHTFTIKQIMSLPYYRKLFGVDIKRDSSAKDEFHTHAGGCIAAFGSAGAITGRNAGLPGLSRFSGCVVMDDMHKPDEVHSDTVREGVITNFKETIKERVSSPTVPMFSIGQRLRQGDLPDYLLQGNDGYYWHPVILKALDEAGNALCPSIRTKEMLLIEQKHSPYVFASQHQQNPIPAGGAIFKKSSFFLTHEDPKMLATFITCDTAETEKSYNDATVFSFWGLYKINDFHRETNQYALHWLDCVEIRVKPSELEDEFMQFYARAMTYKMQPSFAAIELKSTGVTLASVLKEVRGLRIREIERTRASGSKIDRFLNIESHVAKGLVSLPRYAAHTEMCIEHCSKITANNSHAHDDIADTLYDAVKIALIDKTIITLDYENEADEITQSLNYQLKKEQKMRGQLYG